MGVNFINKYQNLVISKKLKKSLKIVKFEVDNIKFKICVQILELIKNKTVQNYTVPKIVHWMGGWA